MKKTPDKITMGINALTFALQLNPKSKEETLAIIKFVKSLNGFKFQNTKKMSQQATGKNYEKFVEKHLNSCFGDKFKIKHFVQSTPDFILIPKKHPLYKIKKLTKQQIINWENKGHARLIGIEIKSTTTGSYILNDTIPDTKRNTIYIFFSSYRKKIIVRNAKSLINSFGNNVKEKINIVEEMKRKFNWNENGVRCHIRLHYAIADYKIHGKRKKKNGVFCYVDDAGTPIAKFEIKNGVYHRIVE